MTSGTSHPWREAFALLALAVYAVLALWLLLVLLTALMGPLPDLRPVSA